MIANKETLLSLPWPSLKDVVNVASVPQRSPFRYPGGKTWLVPQVRRWLLLMNRRPLLFVEPFAGGGIAGLTVAFENLAKQVLMVELDPEVASVWRTILNGGNRKLADRIRNFDLTLENVQQVLTAKHRTVSGLAFATILRNRVQHGGILAPGAAFMRKGENGKGIQSRWYPETLAKRIRNIHAIRDRIVFRQGDAFDVIETYQNEKNIVFFVDPPYTVAGKRLYRYSEIDHEKLFDRMSSVAGDVLLTYDDTPEIRRLSSRFEYQVETIMMKNRQNSRKSELLIGRDLSWLRGE
ncbi:MAG: DNA adenine methylase [Phycisphaerae bacterium]|nr:DNA adenine methylase [Phycisphaerae bacterium]